MMADIVFWLALAVLALLQPVDIWSTNRFLAAGVREAGPLMALAQRWLGGAWWVPKILLMLLAGAGLAWYRAAWPMATALLLAVAIGVFVVVIWRNVKAGSR